jgi:ankyrin repeat protein
MARFIHAMQHGNYGAAKDLIIWGESAHAICDQYGNTPLFLAAHYGQLDLFTFILSFDEVDPTYVSPHGYTILHNAAFSSNEDGMTILRIVMEMNIFDINIQAKDGCTPLHHAMYRPTIPKIRYLLQHGADLFIKTEDGNTPYDLVYSWNRDTRDYLLCVQVRWILIQQLHLFRCLSLDVVRLLFRLL